MKTSLEKLFLFAFFACTANQACAQYVDTIEVRKSWGVKYLRNDQPLKPKQLLNMMLVDPEAYAEMRIAKNNYNAGAVFGFAGGFLIGWEAGNAIVGREVNGATLAGGAGLILIGAIFNGAYNRHAQKAVSRYNVLFKSIPRKSTDFALRPCGAGLALQWKF